jgi:membrane-associated protease RseP (regulator of RpoE activity)
MPFTEPTRHEQETDDTIAPLVMNPDSRLLVVFEGHLRLDSETAYERLDEKLALLDLLALFRETSGRAKPQSTAQPARQPRQLIYIVQGRVNPKPRSWIPNLVLFLLTLFSLFYVGMFQALGEIASRDLAQAEALVANGLLELWRGYPYAFGIMLILGAHELGHYFAARRRKIAVTLPYFLPNPLDVFLIGLIGTFGAFIQLRQPIRNRKMLLEIGAAGPLAGLIFAIPILLLGLATSPVKEIQTGIVEGNSLLYAVAKIITFGRFLPDGTYDVYVNQLAWAGWTGLLVTGLNLIPIGQLDGGHVMYALFGNRAKSLYFPVMAILTLLVLTTGGTFILMLFLLLLLGRTHAVPLDDITPLDPPHRLVAIVTLVVFALVFVPVPLTPVISPRDMPSMPLGESASLPMTLAMVGTLATMLWLRLRR